MWMTAFAETLYCGHLGDKWEKDPSFAQEGSGPREVGYRSWGSHVVITTSAGGSSILERTRGVGHFSRTSRLVNSEEWLRVTEYPGG